jgi:hypothetical protein
LTCCAELKSEYGAKLLLGSGTVTTAAQAKATIDAGAEFVVSPSFHPDVIAVTKARGKLSIPGALTPTEVITAWDQGADYVKIFPCSAMGGASYLKSLLAPFPHLKLIPTGGVTHHTAVSFLGSRGAGAGRGQRPGEPGGNRSGRAGGDYRGGAGLPEGNCGFSRRDAGAGLAEPSHHAPEHRIARYTFPAGCTTPGATT